MGKWGRGTELGDTSPFSSFLAVTFRKVTTNTDRGRAGLVYSPRSPEKRMRMYVELDGFYALAHVSMESGKSQIFRVVLKLRCEATCGGTRSGGGVPLSSSGLHLMGRGPPTPGISLLPSKSTD